MKTISQLLIAMVLATAAVQAAPKAEPEVIKIRTVDGVECFAKRSDGNFERNVDLYGCGLGKRGDEAVECFAKRADGLYERNVDLYGCGLHGA